MQRLLKLIALSLFSVALPALLPQSDAQTRVDFARDIQPILQAHCTRCHNGQKAMARLRLDDKTSALRTITPGNSRASLLLQRVRGEGGERMPLGGEPLSEAQIELLRRWIDEGASWPDSETEGEKSAPADGQRNRHWAFIAPKRPALPAVKTGSWVKNPIDAFVLARLEREGLPPSPEAERALLLRRVSLDLTGVSPTLKELDAFLADASPDAYEKAVDRLLSSPRYGERMAFRWLDAARYADTNGYQIDGDRSAWRWRDWVISAFNANKPFDQFVVEQLAGDLLPNPTLEQRIATAFNRNHRINAEGGIVPEEYRIEYVVDRVDTTSTVFMGLTLGCARCHNHKYDPFTQREYYQLSAYFNSIDEDGHSFDQGNSPPVMLAPTESQQQRLAEFDRDIAQAETRVQNLLKQSARAARDWEKSLRQQSAPQQWFPEDKLLVRVPLDEKNAPVFHPSDRKHHDPDEKKKEEAKKLVIGFKDGAPQYVPAPTGQGATFDGKRYFDAGLHADFRYKSTSADYRERFSISAWVYPESEQSGSIITKVSDSPAEIENNVPRAGGYGLYFLNGKLHFNMIFRWGEDALRTETESQLPLRQWHHVAVVFDGTQSWEDRLRIYVNGQAQKLNFTQRNFFLLFGNPNDTLKIGAGGGPQFRFKGALAEVRLYSRLLAQDEIGVLACGDSLNQIAALAPTKRSAAQTLKLQQAFIAQAAPEELQQAQTALRARKEERLKFIDTLPTLMVMQELPAPRPTFLLRRGAYDAPGEKIERRLPAEFPPLPAAAPNNRLGFARWLFTPEHPLTARVAVNRYWQMLFGAGLVRTTEDFGTQGELPSHPELLDWLAVEFRESGWDVKRLLKTIVLSATYRQASRLTPQLQQTDPNNRLLARGPRVRLSAEMIRDQALSVSGLLVEKLGGPSVKPYQPDGLYKDMAFSGLTGYEHDKGDGLWRRSLYTFWKRTVLSPTMQVFDASAREFCTVRDTRTNTPLQSLNLMNDVTYLEAARLLAERMLKEGGTKPDERLAWAFRLLTARTPRAEEVQVLLRNLTKQQSYFAQHPAEATKLLAVGDKRNDAQLSAPELAAYASTASLLLNLDEAITKQ